jgi:hypothetical protein
MADNIGVTPGTGATCAADDVGGVLFQRIKPCIGADGTAVDVSAGAGSVGTGVQRVTLASDDPLVAGQTRGVLTCTTTITRPSDTSAYTAGDALSNSTSSPTAGGGTFTSAVGASGKSAILTDVVIVSSNAPATPLQGELWIFDTAPTAINDNAAFTVSDAEMLTCVAQVPFALSTIGANSSAHVQCGIGVLAVGSANLRFLIRVVNAYTPASAETITFRAKFQGVN